MTTKVNLPSIKELRQKGWKVRVSHYRYPTRHSDLTPIKEMKDDDRKYLIQPEGYGGKIVIEAKDPDGKEFFGESVCSKTEAFCKTRGRNLALARAIGGTETKFKVRDEVYMIWYGKITKLKIETVNCKLEIEESSGDIIQQELYKVIIGGECVVWTDSSQLFTKEELINSIS